MEARVEGKQSRLTRLGTTVKVGRSGGGLGVGYAPLWPGFEGSPDDRHAEEGHAATVLHHCVDHDGALDGVSVQVAEGETLGIVGESGSGKTTLARLFLLLDRPTAGSLLFDGMETHAFGRDDFERAGCRFHPRCPRVLPQCESQEPEMREVKPGRFTACHLY